jgi:hypothetical protein
MSEQRPDSESADMASTAGPADSFSSNGTYPEAAVAVAEGSDEEEAATAEAESTDASAPEETPEPGDVIDEPIAAEAEPDPAADANATDDDGTVFLAELVRVMQSTAGAERQRIDDETARRRDAHLAAIQSRRESEVATMRELAAEDLKSIDAWADGERQRIEQEREKRAAALQEDLETSLAEHGSKIDQEVEAVEVAITGYVSEVDAFFATIEQETDPVAIARHASRRPAFPSLDVVATTEVEPSPPAPASDVEATAEAATDTEPAAETDPTPIGVMHPQSSSDLADEWSRWNEGAAVDAAEPPVATEDQTADTNADEAVPVAAGDQTESSSILKSTTVHRPMAWLLGDRNDDR